MGMDKLNIRRNVLLNPGPATTTDTVKMAQIVPDICPREKEFADRMAQFRKDILGVVHADPKEYTSVLFCGSGTICIDVCVNSLLPEGRKMLIVDNGAYSSRAAEVCGCYGLPHIDLKSSVNDIPDLKAIEEALENDPDIAVVYCCHHETGTGVLNPIREIGAAAHRHGAILIADTTSSLGMIPIDVERDNIDFCMASAQKGIMAMTGLSFVIGKTAEVVKSKDYPVRSFYCNLYQQYAGFEKNGEMRFTPPVQTVYAALQGLKEYYEEGEAPKYERHLRVNKAIHEGLAKLGLKEAIRPEIQSGLVVSVLYPEDPRWNFGKVHDYCYERGFTIYPGKISTSDTFRLCSLGAIDENDIKDFFAVFTEALDKIGIAHN